jgi:chromate reductase
MAEIKASRPKVAVIVGSNRRESINRKLAQALGRLARNKLDFIPVRIDDLPMYNQDLESDLPATVSRFKGEVEAADAVLFVTPEHSRSIPAVLKNAIDWGARPWGKTSWPGKPGAVTGTSTGSIGTAIAQQHLHSVLSNQGLILLGGEAYITYKPDLVSHDDGIADESVRGFLQSFVDQFAALIARFVPHS